MRLDGKLCANCFKIVESVSRTAQAHGGMFKLVVRRPGQVILQLSCAQDHSWTIGMQSRKAKNWCRRCKEELRVEHERQQLERLEQLREEQLQSQQALFEQARLQQEIQDLQQGLQLPQESPQLQSQRRRLQHLLVDQLLNPCVDPLDPQLQHQVTDLILEVDEALLEDFLQQLEDQQSGRSQSSSLGSGSSSSLSLRQLVQRLRLCLHPDKNRSHPRAGEAFARMT